MSALVFALALLTQDAAVVTAAPAPVASPAPAPSAPALPRGAPRDDYQLVAWCYGALRGYVDLYEEVMPEVRRIETTYRAPGSSLAEDLKVYADQQKQARKDLARFQAALTAAEKASMRPLNAQGGEAVRRGHNVWSTSPATTKARKAQEWMSWSLPAVCGTTADALTTRSALMAPALRANSEPAPEPEVAPVKPAVEMAVAPTVTDSPAAPTAASSQAPATPPTAAEAEARPVIVEDAPATTPSAASSEEATEGVERPWTRRLKARQEAKGKATDQ